jgi:hypothetical protein
VRKWNFDIQESIGKVVEALAKASGEFQTITKSATNPYYEQKYADLSALIEERGRHSRPTGWWCCKPRA